MATQITLDGKIYKIPGVYTTIKSGIKNPALNLAFGNALLIDTGVYGFRYGGGSGVNGTLKQGKDSIYTFDNASDFRTFIRGGVNWLLAEPLFLPGGGATAGVSSLTYIKAATTIPATIAMGFGDFASDVTDNGSITVQLKDEGDVGNGVLGDEVRAKSTITITNAGSNGNVISVSIQGRLVGSYTVQTGNTIAQVVTGLAANITTVGLAAVFSTNSTQIVIQAIRGSANTINGVSPTIAVTGTVNGAAGAFAGGVEGTILTRGIASKVVAGVNDPTKFILQFWRGTFKGLDTLITNTSNPVPFDNISELAAVPELIVQSPEVNTVQALVNWMQDTNATGYTFGQYFNLITYTLAPVTDEIVHNDIAGYTKATGGSATYSLSDLTAALDSLDTAGYDFILSDRWGSDARSTQNLTIETWIQNTAKIKPDLYVASGSTVADFATSLTVASAYNDEYVTTVHGGAKITDIGGRTFKEYKSIYKAANLLGREAGLQPQVPLTFKNIGIQGELHSLKEKELNQCLDKGLLVTRLDNGSFEVLKGINTLQNNSFLVNPDGSTHSKQLSRIKRQLSKELVFNLKSGLLKKPDGANRNTVSPEDVKSYVEAYLTSKTATDTQDNLLLSFSNVTVSVQGDAYTVTYTFTPNFEISFVVTVGIIVDPNS